MIYNLDYYLLPKLSRYMDLNFDSDIRSLNFIDTDSLSLYPIIGSGKNAKLFKISNYDPSEDTLYSVGGSLTYTLAKLGFSTEYTFSGDVVVPIQSSGEYILMKVPNNIYEKTPKCHGSYTMTFTGYNGEDWHHPTRDEKGKVLRIRDLPVGTYDILDVYYEEGPSDITWYYQETPDTEGTFRINRVGIGVSGFTVSGNTLFSGVRAHAYGQTARTTHQRFIIQRQA